MASVHAVLTRRAGSVAFRPLRRRNFFQETTTAKTSSGHSNRPVNTPPRSAQTRTADQPVVDVVVSGASTGSFGSACSAFGGSTGGAAGGVSAWAVGASGGLSPVASGTTPSTNSHPLGPRTSGHAAAWSDLSTALFAVLSSLYPVAIRASTPRLRASNTKPV